MLLSGSYFNQYIVLHIHNYNYIFQDKNIHVQSLKKLKGNLLFLMITLDVIHSTSHINDHMDIFQFDLHSSFSLYIYLQAQNINEMHTQIYVNK